MPLQIENQLKRCVTSALRFAFSFVPTSDASKIDPRSILVVRQHDQLGDMLCVVPTLRALRQRWPNAHITLVASPVNYAIMQLNPFADTVLNYDKQSFRSSLASGRSFWKELRGRHYDLAIVPVTVSNSLTSNLLAYLSRAKVRLGAESLNGVENPAAFCFNVPTHLDWRPEPHRHQTRRNMDILQPLGISTDDLSVVLGLSEDERSIARERLTEYRPDQRLLIGFHPGAGKLLNRWPASRFAALANELCTKLEATAIVTAGPMDDEPVAEMIRLLRRPHMVIRNEPIRDVAALLSHLDLFITNDTGIMHVAAGVGVPTLSLFGPTDPLQWAPVGGKHKFLLAEDGRIESIRIERVLSAVDERLSVKKRFITL